MCQEVQLFFRPNIRMGKKYDVSDFDHAMIVGARQGGLSISETADPLTFSHATVSRVCRELCKKKRSVEKGQTGQSCQEGDSNANNHTLQQWYAEEHLWTHIAEPNADKRQPWMSDTIRNQSPGTGEGRSHKSAWGTSREVKGAVSVQQAEVEFQTRLVHWREGEVGAD